MKPEDKELLLKDLCARLTYGVKCNVGNIIVTLEGITKDGEAFADGSYFDAYDIKPYLRPMSSMTEEELKAYRTLCKKVVEGRYISDGKTQYGENLYRCYDKSTKYYDTSKSIDFLNEFHFDHHGLIKKFLALPAPKDMYKIK